MTDPEFLDLEDVLLIHSRQLAKYGGAAGIRDQALLESALAMPMATLGGEFVYADLFAMAAAYAFHIAENQTFLERQQAHRRARGRGLPGAERPRRGGAARLYEAMIAVAERRLDKAGLAELFRELSRPVAAQD